MKSIRNIFFILLIGTSFIFSSCTKTKNCPGISADYLEYFPDDSLVRFVNDKNQILSFNMSTYDVSKSRTESNNPWRPGFGGAPQCVEELRCTMSDLEPLSMYFRITLLENNKLSELVFSITEMYKSHSYFYANLDSIPSNTSNHLFGDTLTMHSDIGRFSFAKIIYGKGVVQLNDRDLNCQWNRIY